MKHNARNIILLVLAFVLVIGASVGGTLAWLTAQTPAVTNTFTSAALLSSTGSFTLWESEAEEQTDGSYKLLNTKAQEGNTYNILPGVDIPKDPTVTIDDLQENAYLYIVVDNKLTSGLTFSYATGWSLLDGYTNVYVYTANGSNVIKPGDYEVKIIENDTITVPANYSATGDGSLTFTAYLAQATGNGANAVKAWENSFPGVGTQVTAP